LIRILVWPSGAWERKMHKTIQTENSPQAIGVYSQGIITGQMVFTSGQIAIDPATGNIVVDDFRDEVRQVLKNLSAVLEAGGSALDHVVKCTVFMKDLGQFSTLNEVFGEFFPHDPPARSAVEVCALPKNVNVEIEAIGMIID